MYIEKRNGQQEPYCAAKITTAMSKAFASLQTGIEDDRLRALTRQVEARLEALRTGDALIKVEQIQDLVEQVLMQNGHFEAAKRYILYRSERSQKRRIRDQLTERVDWPGLSDTLYEIQKTHPDAAYQLDLLLNQFAAFHKPGMDRDEAMRMLIKAAAELTDKASPDWEFIAARLLMLQTREQVRRFCAEQGIRGFYEKITYLEKEGLYGDYIRAHYTEAELTAAAEWIDAERDALFNYAGLDLLLRRYVIRSRRHEIVETPQEMFLGIALHLALRESPDCRLTWARRFYDMLSCLQVTMATPTLSNARKPHHQLSSCFIDTVPDELDGIYRSITNFAKVSKFGGGMGLYFGKVRAVGSAIRGFDGVAGGVIRWIKLANDTAVAVDQLGMRQGSVACYLDVWHKDIPEFLQLRTNNGDDRMKAHDIFPAVCYPDLFWRTVRDDLDAVWHLMCPHEIHQVKGYHLEDSYGDEWEQRYLDCVADPRIGKRTVPIKELVRLILKSCVETGTPFTFNRDAVNRANPNKHRGIIYCSNLCTEICQNMSPVESISVTLEAADGSPVVVERTAPGDFVVCNLASLSLGRLDVSDPAAVRDTVQTVVRALDNVIDLNFYPLPYARHTSQAYRAIGLGVSGYHHMLARQGIRWESDEHLAFADRVFETINYEAIRASLALAREKGRYRYFEGSDWQTGAYFDRRGYNSADWRALRAEVARHGLRNAYLLAVAPTSSTSIIAGTTAGLDPVMNRYYLEEKKGSIVPRVAPDLTPATYWLYKQAHQIDQTWTVRAAGIRQRHIDQAQSFNLYITQNLTFRQILNCFIRAWEQGVKTIYYCRSLALEVTECDSCSA